MARAAAVIAVLAAMALAAPAAGAAEPPSYAGASADGGEVFFTTTEQLVPGDTDGKRDVYERSYDAEPGIEAYVTREISTGPGTGNDFYDATFAKVSADGSKVFFTTAEPLVAADGDRKVDVYVRNLPSGPTELVSVGQGACEAGCGNPSDAGFAGAAAGGNEVFFRTEERLVAGDKDNAGDIYMRDLTTKTTTLVSAGEAACAPACGNEEVTATLDGVSADGSRAFFRTTEQLSSADTDTAQDIYARDLPSGPTELVSAGDPACATCGSASEDAAEFAASSADGSRAFFETSEKLVEGDDDGAKDVYERAGGATTLVSAGSQSLPAKLKAASEAGDRVLFTTSESLVGADENSATDVYEWSGGGTSLVTSGSCTQGSECGSTFQAAPADATKLLFTTTEPLDAADEDLSADVYEVEVGGGSPALDSAGAEACAPLCGNGAVPAIFDGASSDGSAVFLSSDEQLAPEDKDSTADVYARVGGETVLLTPSGYCPVKQSECKGSFVGASGDGAHVFFQTVEHLTLDDLDFAESDIYERELGGEGALRLVSTGNSPEIVLGPPPPVLEGTDPASPSESTAPRVLGHAEPGSEVALYTSADCSGAPAATGTAAELESPGIQVTVGEGTTSLGAMASDESEQISGCSNAISYKQETPPPPPPPPPAEEGSETGTEGGGGSGGSAGNDGSTGNSGIVYVTPRTRITFGPASKTRKRKVVFRFTDATGQPGTGFLCRLDRKAWHRCGSPQRLKRLRPGRHVFRVKAENAVGAWEERPVKRKFKVVRGGKRRNRSRSGRSRG